jgi:hypothetical protein
MQIKIACDVFIAVEIDHYEPGYPGNAYEPPVDEELEWHATSPVVNALLDISPALREQLDLRVLEQLKDDQADSQEDAACDRWYQMQEAI